MSLFLPEEYNIVNNFITKFFKKKQYIITKIGFSEGLSLYTISVDKEKFIFKMSADSKNTRIGLRNEYETLVFLKKNNIKNIPNPIYFCSKNNMNFLLISFIVGTKNISFIKLAKVIARIHEIKIKADKTSFDFVLEQTKIINDEIKMKIHSPEWSIIMKRIQNVFKNILENLYLNKNIFYSMPFLSLLHMDLSLENILASNNKIYVIDWSESTFGDKSFDLARLFYRYPYLKEIFLKEYLKYIYPDNSLLRRISILETINIIQSILQEINEIYSFTTTRLFSLFISNSKEKSILNLQKYFLLKLEKIDETLVKGR